MKNIKELLLRVIGLDKERKNLKKIIKEEIFLSTKVELNDEQIDFNQGLVSLKIYGSPRNEIFLNKKEIEDKINLRTKEFGSFVKIK